MKSRLFHTAMLVLIVVLVLATPASARPAPLTVADWAISTYGDGTVQFGASGVTWTKETKAVSVQLVFTQCLSGTCEAVILEAYQVPAKGKVTPVNLINGQKLWLANVTNCTSQVSVRLVRADGSVSAEVMFPNYPRADYCLS